MNEKAQLVSLRRLWIVTWLCGSCCVVFDLRRLVTGLGIGFSGTRFVHKIPILGIFAKTGTQPSHIVASWRHGVMANHLS